MSVDVELAFVEPNRVLVNGNEKELEDDVVVVLPTHTPLTAKHPDARLIPPVPENEEVAVEKLMPAVSPMANIVLGEVVPIPRKPFLFTVRADIDDVAKESDDVAMNRLPLFDENIQCFRFDCAAVSVSANCPFIVALADVDATCNIHLGVVDPIPTNPLFLIVNLSALLLPLLPVTNDSLAGTDPTETSPSTNPSTRADSCVPDPSYPLNPRKPSELSCITGDGLFIVPSDLIRDTPDLPLNAPAEYSDTSDPAVALSYAVFICAPVACRDELVVPMFSPLYIVALSPTYRLLVVVAPPDIVRPPF
jgi:hypothetical protein